MRMQTRSKTGIAAFGLALALVLAVAATGCDDDKEPTLGTVTPAALHAELQNKDFLLINVHVPYEGEIPGTDAHITYEDVDAIAEFIGDDLDRKVVIYCKSDTMTLVSGPPLVDRGYTNIRYLEGGMRAWEEAGYTLDSTATQ